MDDDLGVGVRIKRVTLADEVFLDLREVVDLPIEDDPDRLILIVDRLMAGRQVDDAQPAHAQGGLPVDIEPFVVGPAVDDDVGHPLEQGGGVGRQAARVDESADTAHGGHFTRIIHEKAKDLCNSIDFCKIDGVFSSSCMTGGKSVP